MNPISALGIRDVIGIPGTGFVSNRLVPHSETLAVMQHTTVDQHPRFQCGVTLENRVAVFLGRVKTKFRTRDITNLASIQKREPSSAGQITGTGVLVPLRLVEIREVEHFRICGGRRSHLGRTHITASLR